MKECSRNKTLRNISTKETSTDIGPTVLWQFQNYFKVAEVFKHAKRHKSLSPRGDKQLKSIPESDLRDCDLS